MSHWDGVHYLRRPLLRTSWQGMEAVGGGMEKMSRVPTSAPFRKAQVEAGLGTSPLARLMRFIF